MTNPPKSLSELRDEWENGSETFLLATSCAAALAGPIERERRLVEQASVMATVLRDMDDAHWLDEADRILQTRGREAVAEWRSLVTPGAAPMGGGK